MFSVYMSNLFHVLQYLYKPSIDSVTLTRETHSPCCCVYQKPLHAREVSCCSEEKSEFACGFALLVAERTEDLVKFQTLLIDAVAPRRVLILEHWRIGCV
jgi:hypothetical protein